MTRNSFLLLLGGAAVSAGSAISSPRRPDFSGRWTADMEESDFGSFPKPAALTRVVTQDDLRLTIAVEYVDHQKKPRSGELRFSLDGEESVNEAGGSQVVGFARRLGSHVLVHTSRTVDGMRFDVDELWSLSDDGKTLTVEGAVTTSMGEEDLSVILRKQER